MLTVCYTHPFFIPMFSFFCSHLQQLWWKKVVWLSHCNKWHQIRKQTKDEERMKSVSRDDNSKSTGSDEMMFSKRRGGGRKGGRTGWRGSRGYNVHVVPDTTPAREQRPTVTARLPVKSQWRRLQWTNQKLRIFQLECGVWKNTGLKTGVFIQDSTHSSL